MKKIVGIIAAMAMVASVFAWKDETNASIGASIKMGGDTPNSLFKFTKGADDSVDVLMYHANPQHPHLSLTIDLGVVGGNIDANGNAEGKIWFMPFNQDMLKVSIGDVGKGDGLCGAAKYKNADPCEPFDNGGGFRLDITPPVDGLALGLGLYTGGSDKWWDNNAFPVNFWLSYTNDSVGKIAFIFDEKGTPADDGADAKYFTDLRFGAGWTKSFGVVTPTLNVIGDYNNEKFQTICIEPTIAANLDPITLSAYIPVKLDLVTEGAKPNIGVDVIFNYHIADGEALNSAGVKAAVFNVVNIGDAGMNMCVWAGVNGTVTAFENTNWEFSVEVPINAPKGGDAVVSADITAKLSGNYGGMSWDIGATAGVGKDKFEFNIPFTCEIGF